jgi:N-acetylglucosaminyldiphosphoundecaprenol N-acetyl-beta-D-mannosaminyltransferase
MQSMRPTTLRPFVGSVHRADFKRKSPRCRALYAETFATGESVTNRSIVLDGLRIDNQSSEEILALFCQKVREKSKIVFAYVNAHAFNLAGEISWLRTFINNADVVVADGQGIRFACWALRKRIPPHFPLTRWIWEILQTCQAENFSVFFLGGDPDTVVAAKRNVASRLPRLKIVGIQDGYFQKEGKASDRVVELINVVSPDLLVVGFGMPLQEEWIRKNLPALNVRAILPVGGCIDILGGKRSEAPEFMRAAGVEWVWRLIHEPRRLFIRYVIGNPKFVWRVLSASFRSEHGENEERM